jgi:hypothetical protein
MRKLKEDTLPKMKVVASCGSSGGIEAFGKLVNDYFYAKSWRVYLTANGWKAIDTAIGSELSELGFILVEIKGRYQIKRILSEH